MKHVFLILCFLVSLHPAFSQQDSSKRSIAATYREVTFGVNAGISSGSLYGKDLHLLSADGWVKPQAGVAAGVVVNSRLGKYFGIKSELSIGQSGAMLHLSDSTTHQPYNSRFKSTYLFIQPLLPTLYLHGFRLSAGPYLSGLISASMEIKNNDGKIVTNKNIFGSPSSPGGFRYKIDAGMVIALNYEFKNGFNVGASYRRGFIPVMEDPRTQSQWKIYNQQLNCFIGYTWKKK